MATMNSPIEAMYRLQELVRLVNCRQPTAEQQREVDRLRAEIPPRLLVQMDRVLARGRTMVSLVRHGVCGGCHLRVALGTAAMLVVPDTVVTCESCGSYLRLADDEPRGERKPKARRVEPALV